MVRVLHRLCLLFVLVLAVAGCGGARRLMPTPNLYLVSGWDTFDKVPKARQEKSLPIIFATDRMPLPAKPGKPLAFGIERSRRLRVGTCPVEIGTNLTWEELVAASRSPKRTSGADLKIGEPKVLVTYPGTYWGIDAESDYCESDEIFDKRWKESGAEVSALIRDQLAQTDTKDVYVYIHGYNNTFDDSIEVAADLWHFMGRQGVFIAYSWPAGARGLKGYEVDSESGEFTLFHLKLFLADIAATPEVGRIHLLAHSRGTDITMSALRELAIYCSGKGVDPRTHLKLGRVVLAAPDIDIRVAGQRILCERLPAAVESLTIYSNAQDRALLVSNWLHGGAARLGFFKPDALTEKEAPGIAKQGNFFLIDSRVKTNFLAHNYFYTNPATSSDLILNLRDGRHPGAEKGRPLKKDSSFAWTLEQTYPLKKLGWLDGLGEMVGVTHDRSVMGAGEK